jgi:hypothetical protein
MFRILNGDVLARVSKESILFLDFFIPRKVREEKCQLNSFYKLCVLASLRDAIRGFIPPNSGFFI